MKFESQSSISLLNAYVKAEYGDTEVLVIIQKHARTAADLTALWEDLERRHYGLPKVFLGTDYVFIANTENMPTVIEQIMEHNRGVHMRYYKKGVCTMKNRY